MSVERGAIGQALMRREDAALLAGRGRFIDDIRLPGELHCVFVRSPHANARIRAIDTTDAGQCSSVAAVYTGRHLEAAGVGPMRAMWALRGADGAPMAEPPRWALARGVVRHVGEPVAVVIAQSADSAADAAERVAVDYEPLAAVADAPAALRPGAPQVHEEAAANVCFRFARGDRSAVDAAFAAAAHVTRLELVNQRLCGCALETRGIIAVPEADGLLLYDTTQTPHHVRASVAEELGMRESALRVIAPDVGGGFGYKGKHYPEETVLAWAALKLGKPLRWLGSRSESFLADTQGRDHHTRAELALDRDGRFTALRVETVANLGAYVSTFGAAIPAPIYSALLAGLYRTRAIYVEVIGVFSNTTPVDAYRGAGRPEACYVLERLADRAARELGLDRAEIRRRNLIPRDAMPYRTPLGPVYDCGDFPRLFERALAAAAYDGFEARRAEAARRGRLRGIGLACYLESSGVAPSRLAGAMGARAGFFESAELRVDAAGRVQAILGTHNHGQGHATSFAQIIADVLGVAPEDVTVLEGDTGAVPVGTGTFGSRSIAVGGSAIVRAAEKVLEKAKRLAAHRLEADAADIAFERGRFRVTGTDRSVSLAELARAAHLAHDLPPDMEPGLAERALYDPPSFAFSNGVHVCEIEVDPETGEVRLAGYWTVDDVGTVINPMIVAGQIHGGLAQGVGQALLERTVYDATSAQPMTGSFMDYALPRADSLPQLNTETDESQPCTHNPLGAKGCGEAGAIGAPAAVMSALLDALAPHGIEDLEMPATPERLWCTLRVAGFARR